MSNPYQNPYEIIDKALKEGVIYKYLRKSQADIEKEKYGQFETLTMHERDLDDMAARMNIKYAGSYRELVSGESIAERTEFQALMRKVQDREVTAVAVHRVDRLGRGDAMEYGWVLSVLKFTRTYIITPTKTYDPTNPADYQSLQFQMFFANTELETIKLRFHDAKERKVKDGNYLGSVAPYGYDKLKRGRDKTLKLNDDAPIVKIIFERMAEHTPAYTLAQQLNSEGLRTTNGKEWTANKIKNIVRNVIYRGDVSWYNRPVEIAEREGLASTKYRPRNFNPLICEGLHEPIVSRELWAAANAALGERAPRTHTALEIQNPFAGILVCAHCGRAMRRWRSVVKGVEYIYLRHDMYTECKLPGVRLDILTQEVIHALLAVAHEAEIKAMTGDDGRADWQVKHDAIERDLASSKRKSERLRELYMSGDIEIAEFRQARDPLDKRIAELEEALEKINAAVPRDPMEISGSVHKAIAALGDETLSAEVRNAALRKIVERIEYDNLSTERGKPLLKLKIIMR